MQVLMTLLYIARNMQNMQKNMHDMQNMQTSFPICRICTAHFADVRIYLLTTGPEPPSNNLNISPRARRAACLLDGPPAAVMSSAKKGGAYSAYWK